MKKIFGMLKFSGNILDITQCNILRIISFHYNLTERITT